MPPASASASASASAGFVGLGHMGAALARRLLAAGHAVTGFDLDAAAVARVPGLVPAPSLADLVARCDVVFACLPSPAASLAVAHAMREGGRARVLVETSTAGPAALREMAAVLAGRAQVVDAPVSGGPRGAEAGTLSLMLAGDPAAIDGVLPMLQALANKRFVVGREPGLAQVCKLVNNAISAAGMLAACEATVVGAKAGLDPQTMLDAINAGSGRNAATQDKFPRAILPGTFDYGGPLGLMLKDLSLFIEEAQAAGVPSPMAQATFASWDEAVRRNGAQADYSEAIRHLETDAGVAVRARSAVPANAPRSATTSPGDGDRLPSHKD